MKKITVLLVMLVSVQICYSNDRKNKLENVEVTYIANDGFLLNINDKKILIDALFGDKEYEWCVIPSQETINSILNNDDIFTDVDLIAATHKHVDHFYPHFVVKHLLNNTNGKFISCKQSVDLLKKTDDYDKVKNHIVEITPDNFSYIDTIINEVEIRVYRISHGPYYIEDPKTGEKINKHQNIQNIGFLFNINGVKIFHTGDSNENGFEEYKHFRLDKEHIDIAFIDYAFIWKPDSQGVEIMKNYINAKHFVLMHLHPDKYTEYIEKAAQLSEVFPSIHIFKNKMEIKKYIIE